MSLLLHKDRGQVLVVNREEKEGITAFVLLWGYVGLAHAAGIPRKLSGLHCLAVFTEMSQPQYRTNARHYLWLSRLTTAGALVGTGVAG